MKARLSAAMIWCAVLATALVVAPMLARNILAIPVLAPLDPNEGWNAAYALAAMTGQALYPPAGSLMANNYPPLSFYIVGALARLTGDAVIAGRILALLSFLAVCGGIALVLRQMAGGARAQLFAVLFFAAVLLIASDYVGMDDPQLLGHALQLGALLLVLRKKAPAAALLFAASLFFKHNLLALPLAAAAWLLWQDRRAALSFVLYGIVAAGAGLVLFRLCYGTDLLTQLASPRVVSLANLRFAVMHLWWAVLPLGALFFLRGPWRNFCLVYALAALVLGLVFSAGDGVDANGFFDLAIACALILGLASQSRSACPLAACSAAPLLLFLVFHWSDNNFFFTRDFAAQSARDIAFLKSRPGPALCDQLSLCLWAGKGAQVDVFNIGEAIKTGKRDSAPLAGMIQARHFAVLQLQDLHELGPQLHAAIAQNYRADHSDDNGSFWVPLLTRAP
ncbi:MAG TPA: hypothetical protein VK515_01555 [Rhizomicrobium sp.]|nr:hypothetical protein [Rhizomicrobium sp.]